MTALPDVPSTSVIKAVESRARALAANKSKLMIVGVSPQAARILDRSGLTALIGPENVIPATEEVFGALNRAVTEAREWIAVHSGTPAAGTGPEPTTEE